MTDMYTVTELITPEMAQSYLDRNRNNRPVSHQVVEALAWDMLHDKFVMTEQGIAFDKDLNLVDGQHRLHAIIKSGRAQTMRVTMNAPGIEAPRDRNRIRAAGDFLLDASGARVGQSTRVAAICTAIDLLVTRVDVRPTVDRIRERLEEHRSGIDWVTDAVPARKPAFVQAALAFAYPCNTRGVAEFAEKYVSLADVPAGSPVIALHRAVTEMAHQRAAQRLDAMLKALRCIQLHLHGRRLQRITNLDDGYDYFEHMHAAIRSAKAAS